MESPLETWLPKKHRIFWLPYSSSDLLHKFLTQIVQFILSQDLAGAFDHDPSLVVTGLYMMRHSPLIGHTPVADMVKIQLYNSWQISAVAPSESQSPT